MKNKKNIKKNEKRIAENNRIIKNLELKRKRDKRTAKLVRGMMKNLSKSMIMLSAAVVIPITLMAIRQFRRRYSQQPEGN